MVLSWLSSFIGFLWNEDHAKIQDKMQDLLLEQERELEEQRAKLRTQDLDLTAQRDINEQLENRNYILENQFKEQEHCLTQLHKELKKQTKQSENVVLDAKKFYHDMIQKHKDVADKLKAAEIKKRNADIKLAKLKSTQSNLLDEVNTTKQVMSEYEKCIAKYEQQVDRDGQQIRQLLEDIEEERKQRGEAELQVRSHLDKLEDVRDKIRDFEKRVQELEQSERDLRSEVFTLNSDKQELILQLESKQVENNKQKREGEMKDEELTACKRVEENLRDDLNKNERQLEILKANLQEKYFIIENFRKDMSSRCEDSDQEDINQQQHTMQDEIKLEGERLNRLVCRKSTHHSSE